jgi:hypothetical protein
MLWADGSYLFGGKINITAIAIGSIERAISAILINFNLISVDDYERANFNVLSAICFFHN